MRQIPARPSLPVIAQTRLATQTGAVVSAQTPAVEAASRYSAARRAAWFRSVHVALARLSGYGQRCMCCSGSEATQVEHYRPKAVYPDRTFKWENLLWVCSACNQFKGNRFDEGVPPINPIDDVVWDYLFIDEFGNLCPKWNSSMNDLEPRAQVTITLLGLDREPLQDSRMARLGDLRKRIDDALSLFALGTIGPDDLQLRAMEWFEQPFQPDVADYFFDGPGRLEEPFNRFFLAADLHD